MGNSEVGHLNLGAGAVVRQDLVRIDDAIADGSLARERGAAGGARGRRARAPDRARLRRRRALLARAPARADRARRRELRAPRTWSCTRSPTGATRCRTRAPATWRELDAHRRGRAWARSSVATGRWTATAAGSARSAPTTCSSTVARRTTPTAASRRCATAYERGETDEFIEPTLVGEEARDPAGRQRDRVQLPPRPHAPDHARAGRAGLRRGAVGGAARLGGRGGAPPVARYATLTEYEEGWPYPVAFAPERPATTLVGRARREPALASCTWPRPRSTRT